MLGLVGDDLFEFLRVEKVNGECTKTSKWSGAMTYQVLVDALVELPLSRPALPQLLVVVLKTLPMRTELLETGFVDVLKTGEHSSQHLNSQVEPSMFVPAAPLHLAPTDRGC